MWIFFLCLAKKPTKKYMHWHKINIFLCVLFKPIEKLFFLSVHNPHRKVIAFLCRSVTTDREIHIFSAGGGHDDRKILVFSSGVSNGQLLSYIAESYMLVSDKHSLLFRIDRGKDKAYARRPRENV